MFDPFVSMLTDNVCVDKPKVGDVVTEGLSNFLKWGRNNPHHGPRLHGLNNVVVARLYQTGMVDKLRALVGTDDHPGLVDIEMLRGLFDQYIDGVSSDED